MFVKGGSSKGEITYQVENGKEYIFKLFSSNSNTGNINDRVLLIDKIKIRGIDPIQKMVGMNKFNLIQQYVCSNKSYGFNNMHNRLAKKAISDAQELGIGFFRISADYIKPDKSIFSLTSPELFWDKCDLMYSDLNSAGIKVVPVLNFSFGTYPEYFKETNHEFLTDTNSISKQSLKKFITKYVNRYKDSPTVLFWELSNEANLHTGWPEYKSISLEDWQTHMKWICNLIRKLDPKHMISSGNSEPALGAWNYCNGYGVSIEDNYNPLCI